MKPENVFVVQLLRDHGVATVFTDKAKFPQIPDATAPFIYARLQRSSEDIATGYAPAALDEWVARARAWSAGRVPDDLERVADAEKKPPKSRDVFIYMINGFKPKAPAAAIALIERLSSA